MKKLSLFFPEKIARFVWFGLILLAILFGLTAFNAGGQAALWENVHWTFATWVMVFLGGAGWRNSTGLVKRVRGVFTLGVVSYALGQLLWDFQWAFERTAFPALSDVFKLGMAPFLIVGLLWTVHQQVSRWEEIALYLDAGTLLAAFATTILAIYGPHILVLSWFTIGMLVSYPLVFLALAGAAWVVALSLRAQFGVASPYVLITGLGFSAVCWVLWNLQAMDGVPQPGTLVGYGFSFAHVWVGAGIAVWEMRPSVSVQVSRWSRFMLGALPMVGLSLAMVALVWGQAQNAILSLPMVVGGGLVIFLAGVRQSLLLWERDHLLESERAAIKRAETELAERQRTEEILQASEHLSRKLFTTAQRQTQELALLDKVRTALARELDLPAIFRTVVESIADVFGYTQISLYQLMGETLVLQHQVGYDNIIQEIPISRGVSGEVVRTGKPILLEDVRTHSEFLGAITGVVSEVCVPLFDRELVVGFINVESSQGVKLSEADLNLIVALSKQVGIAIERGRLYRDLQRQNLILAALHATTLTLMSQLELVDVLATIVNQAAQLAGTAHGYIYLVEPDGMALNLQVGIGVNAQFVGVHLNPGEGLAGKVWQMGQPLVIQDYHSWSGHSRQFEEIAFHAAAGVPLTSGVRIAGVLGVEHLDPEETFSEQDVELLNRFAQLASIALENARLYDQAQQELAERKRAEQLARDSQSQLASIINTAINAIVSTDVNQQIILFNPAAEQIFGYSAREVLGQPLDLLLPERFRKNHWEYIRQFSELGITNRRHGILDTLWGLRANGEEFPLEAFVSQSEIEGEKYFTATLHDITERRQAEIERHTLLEIMREAISTPDLPTFLGLVHHAISRVVYAENFFIALHNKATGLFEEVYLVDKYDLPSSPYALDKSLSAYVFRTGQPLLLAQEQFDALVAQGEVELVGTNSPSWLGVPLKTTEDTIGVIVVQDYGEAGRYSQHDVEFLVSIAGQVALAVKRKQSEEALLISERRFSSLVDNSPLSLWEEDLSAPKQKLDILRQEGITDFRTYLNQHPEVVLECLSLVVVTDVNQASLKLYRAKDKEQLLKGLPQLMTPEALAGFREELVMIAEGRMAFTWEGASCTLDGIPLTIQLYWAVVPGYEESLSRVIVSIVDITARKQADEALRDSEDRFRSLVENLPIGLYRTTPGSSGKFLMANPAFLSMFGFTSEAELKKITVSNIYVNPIERITFSDNLLAQGSVRGIQLHLKKCDGTPVWSSVTARVICTEDGKVAHFDCTVEDVTERKRAEEEVKRRAEEFAGLYEIARDLSMHWDLPHVLETIVDWAMVLFQVSGSGIYLYDSTQGDLPVAMDKGPGFLPALRLAFGEGIAGRVGQTRQPLNVDDYMTWEDRSPQYEGIPIRATAAVPMVYYGELIGVLVVEEVGESDRRFSEEDVQFLSLLAAQAASAVHNARLFETTHRRLTELEAISQVSTALRVASSLDEMLVLLLDKTLSLLDTDTGSIILYDPMISRLIPSVGRGWFVSVDQSPLKPDEGVAGYVFSSGEVYRSHQFAVDPRVRSSARSQLPVNWSIICLPLRMSQETVGVMFAAVQHPREFTDDEVRLLNTLAEIAGNAIHRSRLNEQTQRNLRRLAALHAIDLAITSSFDLGVSINVLLEQAMFQLEADAVVVFRLNSSLHTLEYVAGRGLYTTMASKTHLRLGDAYAGQAALERRLISIPDLSEGDSLSTPAFIAVEALRAYHAVPLMAKGQVKGVLEVFHRKPFQPDLEWLNFLQTLGGQAAIALDNAELFTGLQRSNMELTLAYDATIEGWSRALDLRDKETEGHTQRVTEIALRLAEAMDVNNEALIHLRRGGLLHDIGKMGVPDNILLKPGPLTLTEWTFMRRHPEFAYEMLFPIEYLRPALDIPYCHHEKWDGTGYPRGLKGEQIPLTARIFTIVDVWDALRSNRPYRDAWSEETVREYIRAETGKYFDPQVAEAFLAMLNRDDRMS